MQAGFQRRFEDDVLALKEIDGAQPAAAFTDAGLGSTRVCELEPAR